MPDEATKSAKIDPHTPPVGHPSQEGIQIPPGSPLKRGVARSAGVCRSDSFVIFVSS